MRHTRTLVATVLAMALVVGACGETTDTSETTQPTTTATSETTQPPPTTEPPATTEPAPEAPE
ncbi:MAG TPA: hypothetical protein VE569_00005, partial [Acidimicrobiia bacterium]|nr:hypothetical protein [Acidimicrobiia bacterium]